MSDLKYKTEKWDDKTVVLVPFDEYSHIIEIINQMAEALRSCKEQYHDHCDMTLQEYDEALVKQALAAAEPYLDKVVKDA